MDRIKDSGSFDWGSTPHGFTGWSVNLVVLALLADLIFLRGDGVGFDKNAWIVRKI